MGVYKSSFFYYFIFKMVFINVFREPVRKVLEFYFWKYIIQNYMFDDIMEGGFKKGSFKKSFYKCFLRTCQESSRILFLEIYQTELYI